METLEKCHHAEVYCIELIIEFCICNNFQNTILALKKEVQQSDFPWPDPLPKSKERVKRSNVPLIIKLLNNYDHLEFFEKWTTLVPNDIRSLIEYKKLTIYLYTYYATLKYRNKSWDNWEIQNDTFNIQNSTNKQIVDNSPMDETTYPVQKLEKTSGTFILEKPTRHDSLPIVENEEHLSTLEKHDEMSAETSDESSNKEFEADSLENESDSNNDFDANELLLQIAKPDKDSTAMDMFKTYLTENGSEFTNDPEFLPFFALPFVENPKLHPTFTNVFEDNWLNDLKETLQRFLINYSCGDAVIPTLVKLCLKNDDAGQNTIDESLSSSSNLDENFKKFKEVKRKLHRLKKDHQKLVGVATELSSALEKSVQGEAVNLKSTLSNCVQIFPDLFSVDTSSTNPIKWQRWESYHSVDEKIFSYNQVDVRKVKYDLIHNSVKNKLLLLQALRWYITKCKCEEREQVISWFCRQDLLGLKTNFISESLAPTTSPHPIQQSVVRILNALASFSTGRDYIASSKITVQLLLDSTKQNDIDTVTEDMIIATLQKLSLRKPLSDLMVKNGILEWLLNKLDPGPLKKYSLEYSTSLIMNLTICIPSSYWDSREHNIHSLIKLLKSSHKQVVEFICGTLCCIVRSEMANIHCKNVDLIIYLSECLNNHKGDITLEKQIETLIRLHRRELTADILQMNTNHFSDDDLEDPEELESEIDENDLVKGNPSGEQLLSEEYRLVFSTPSVVGRQSSKSHKLIMRPSTPRSSNIPSWARSHYYL